MPSVTLTTTLLTAVTLVLTVSAAIFSYNMIQSSQETAEFQQMVSTMTVTAEDVESVSLRLGSATYLPFKTRSGSLELAQHYDTFTLRVNGTTTLNSPISALRYKGGRLVSSTPYLLRGSNDLIIGTRTTIGRVFVDQIDGPIAALDFRRIQVLNTGYFNFSKGNGWELLNVIEVNFVNMSLGRTVSGSTVNLGFQNKGFQTKNLRLTTPNPSLDTYVVRMEASTGSGANQALNIVVVGRAGGISLDTLVKVTVVKIEVSMLGG